MMPTEGELMSCFLKSALRLSSFFSSSSELICAGNELSPNSPNTTHHFWFKYRAIHLPSDTDSSLKPDRKNHDALPLCCHEVATKPMLLGQAKVALGLIFISFYSFFMSHTVLSFQSMNCLLDWWPTCFTVFIRQGRKPFFLLSDY